MSVVLERVGAVGVMRFEREDRLNALTPEMRRQMERIVTEVRDDATIRALLITGAGRAFCAGGDISTFGSDGAIAVRDRLRQQHRVTLGIYSLEKPVVAAVNGPAFGVGFNIALLADIIVASESARFSQSYSKVGIIPDGGGLYLLARVVGTQRAKEMVLCADVIDAAEAKALGIVREVVPDNELADHAMEFAQRLAAGPTRAFGMTKTVLARGLSMSMEDFLALEASTESVIMESKDHRNAIEAFRSKVEPKFEGQ